jgi:hypothetical protein
MKPNSLNRKALGQSFKFLLLFLILLATTVSAYAATVRGKLSRTSAAGTIYAASYVKVTLSNSRIGDSAPAYTGEDGMYYFYNVPAGDYDLKIWVSPRREPIVVRIQVSNQPYTDVRHLLIP